MDFSRFNCYYFSTFVSRHILDYGNKVPDNRQELLRQISRIPNSDIIIEDFLEKSAIYAVINPAEAIRQFRKNFKQISINNESNSNSYNYIIPELQITLKSSAPARSIEYYLLDSFLISFLYKTLQNINKKSDFTQSLDFIYDEIIMPLFSTKNDQDDIEIDIIELNYILYQRTISLLSRLMPNKSLEVLHSYTEIYVSANEMTQKQKILFLKFFSAYSFDIPTDMLCENKFFKMCESAVEKRTSSFTEIDINFTAFLANVVASSLNRTTGIPAFIKGILIKCIQIGNGNVHNITPISLYINFTHVAFKNIQINIPDAFNASFNLLLQSPNYYKIIVNSLTQIILGPTLIIPSEKICFSCKPKKILNDIQIDEIFSKIINSSNLEMSESQNLALLNFIIATATIDFPKFVEERLSKLENPKEFQDAHVETIFEFFCTILSYNWIKESYPNEYSLFEDNFISYSVSYLEKKKNTQKDSSIFSFSNCMCSNNDILRVSMLIPSNVPKKKFFRTNDWGKIFNPSIECFIFNQVNIDKTTFRIMPPHIDSDIDSLKNPLVHLVSAMSFVSFDKIMFDKQVLSMIPFIFDKSQLVQTVTVRTLQNMVSGNNDCLVEIVNRIFNISFDTDEQHYNILNTLLALLTIYKNKNNKSIDDQQKSQKFLNEAIKIITPLLIYSACSQRFEVRELVFQIFEQIPVFAKFFQRNNHTLFKRFLLKIKEFVGSSTKKNLLFNLNFYSLQHFALTNFNELYHIYLSTFFTGNIELKETFEICQPYIVEKFTNYTKSKTNLSAPTYIMINLMTFLVVNASPYMNDETLSSIFSLIKIIDKNIYFYSISASIGFSRFGHNRLINNFDDKIINVRAFTLAAKTYVQQHKTIEFRLLQECLLNIVSLHNINNFISITEVKPIHIEDPILIRCLLDILWTVNEVFKGLIIDDIANGPFLHKKNALIEPERLQIQSDMWFYFIYNCSKSDNINISKNGNKAFASYCAIFSLSDQSQQIIINELASIIQSNPLSCQNMLSHQCDRLLPVLVQNAHRLPSAFICIAKQFPEITNMQDSASTIANNINLKIESDNSFCNSIYVNVGSLLALSLWYMIISKSQSKFGNYPINVIRNITLTLYLIKKNSVFDQLYQFLYEHKAIDSYDLCMKLSGLLSDAFEMCAEQFIFQSFELLSEHNNCDSSSFTFMIKPWFKFIVLNDSKNFVSNCREICFKSFTTYNFIERLIQVFCSKELDTNSIGVINSLMSIEGHKRKLFYFAMNMYKNNRDECRRFLTHICWTDELSGISDFKATCNLQQYLEFNYWFFKMIQLNEIESLSGLELFFGTPIDQLSEVVNNVIESIKYSDDVGFVLEVASSFFFNEEKSFTPIIPTVLIFCLINSNDRTKSVLNKILGTETPKPEEIYKILDETQRKTFFLKCFEWASSCGDFKIAYTAAKYALEFSGASQKWMVDSIIQTLNIVIESLEERNNNKKITNIIQDDDRLDLQLVYNYILTLLELLSKLNLSLPGDVKPETKVFWIISKFIASDSCFIRNNTKLFFQVVTESLKNHITAGVNISNIPDDYEGIFLLLSQVDNVMYKNIDKFVLFTFLKTATKIGAMGHFEVIAGKTREDVNYNCILISAILFLFPYLASQCPEMTFKHLSKTVMEKIGIDLSLIWDCFRTKNKSFESSGFVESIKQYLSAQIFSSIIKFYRNYIKLNPIFISPIFSICSQLLLLENVPIDIDLYGILIPIAFLDKEVENTKSISSFLKNLQQKSANFGSAVISENFQKKNQLSVKLEPFSSSNWLKQGRIQLVNHSKDFPPFLPIDSDFSNFENVKEIKDLCNKIEIQPFTEWTNKVFKAENARAKVDGFQTANTNFDTFFELKKEDAQSFVGSIVQIEFELNKAIIRKSSADKFSEDEIKKNNIKSEELLSVMPCEFTPNTEYINQIRAGANDKFPSIFCY